MEPMPGNMETREERPERPEERKQEDRRRAGMPGRGGLILVLIPLIGILILSGILWQRCRKAGEEKPGVTVTAGNSAITVRQKNKEKTSGPLETKQTVEVETVKDGLRNMGFLITEEYYFTEMLTNKKAQSLFGVELGFTEESYTVSYEGYITAGIDFTSVGVSCDEEKKVITVTIPKAVMKDTVIDPESVQVYSEKKSLFNDITEEERAEAMAKFKADVEEKAAKKGITDKADKNAELVIRNFVRSFVSADYKIEIVKGA